MISVHFQEAAVSVARCPAVVSLWTNDLFEAGLGSGSPVRRLQIVGQGGQHLVELGEPQSLVLFGSSAPPQQPHLEIGQKELPDLSLLLEAWNPTFYCQNQIYKDGCDVRRWFKCLNAKK